MKEVSFCAYGLRAAVIFKHQILITVVALLKEYGGMIAMVFFVVFHAICRQEGVVGPVTVQIYLSRLSVGLQMEVNLRILTSEGIVVVIAVAHVKRAFGTLVIYIAGTRRVWYYIYLIF